MLRQVTRVLVLGALSGVVLSAQSHALRSTWRAPGVESFDFCDQKVAAGEMRGPCSWAVECRAV